MADVCHSGTATATCHWRAMNKKDIPFHLADKMKASSQRRYEMKNEAEVDETATKWKKSGSTISAYMEQKLDKKSKNIFI